MRVHYEPETVQFYTLAGGNAGILQTARVMRQLVDEYKVNPSIRGLALSLVSHLPGKDEAGEIECVFNFVRDSIRYVKDVYGVETLATPVKTLEIGQGDCDDKATLLAALLESIGYKTMFKLTSYGGTDFQHVYVFVCGLNTAMHLDATEPESAGYEPPGVTHQLYVS